MNNFQFPKNYVVFDTETTGLDPVADKIIEIAAIKVVDGQIIARFNCLINHGIKISEITTKLTTITQELVDTEGITVEDAVKHFLQFMNNQMIVIGHNIVRFDLPFMDNLVSGPMVNKGLFSAMVSPRCFDTAAIYKAKKLGVWLNDGDNFYDWALMLLNQKNPGIKYSIDICCEEMKIDKSQVIQHRAMGDVLLTNEIYKKLCLIKQIPEQQTLI